MTPWSIVRPATHHIDTSIFYTFLSGYTVTVHLSAGEQFFGRPRSTAKVIRTLETRHLKTSNQILQLEHRHVRALAGNRGKFRLACLLLFGMVCDLAFGPRAPSSSSEGIWTLQTQPKHLFREGIWSPRVGHVSPEMDAWNGS